MKSHEKRIEQLEAKTVKEDVPDNLQEYYALEADPESKYGKALDALYNPNRETINPNEAIS